GEDTVAMMVMDMNVEDAAMNYAISMDYTGPITAPTRMGLTYDVRVANDYSYEYTEDDGSVVNYRSVDTTAMRAVANAEIVDGLQNASAELIVDNISTSGYGEDLNTDEETINMNVAYTERLQENGSITGSCALDVNAMDETVGISFDINRAQGEVVDYFADTAEQPLTADTEDAGYSALMADFMGVAADGMALTADDSVMQLMSMFEVMADGGEVYEDTKYEDETAEETHEEDVEDEASVVATLEEAAAIFDGTVPAYTAPEGYSLQEVTVDEYSLYATYASADDEFEMCVYAYSSDDVYYNMTEDGTLTAIEGMVVEMSMYGDNVGSATVRGNGGEVTFYFSGVDMATAEAVMEGLL
ncbi:MAG: hypothetical protein J6M10_09445, partial [Clostridia bacterium]|nr:hypothetical protein [Clostridia bacterium]